MIALLPVPVGKRTSAAFGAFAPRMKNAAKRLRGLRVLHVNATPSGGGVAELLRSLVPYERAAGLRSSWVALRAPAKFFEITKRIHNGLQGKHVRFSAGDLAAYRSVNRGIGRALARIPCDLVVIHDPQPLAAIRSYHRFPTVARIHIDCSRPDARALAAVLPELDAYDGVAFSHPSYVPKGLDCRAVSVIEPAIDPDVPKNRLRRNASRSLDRATIKLLRTLGIDPARPCVVQVSRFDPWKNPLGVIAAYRRAKKRIPGLQLVMMGIMAAQDDPEALGIYRKIAPFTKRDADIHLLARPRDLKGYANDRVVNALQYSADAVLQLSTREGFGLTVTEAMWKGAAVIGGPAQGIRIQIAHEKNGFIAKTPGQAAGVIERLVRDPRLRRRIGEAAHVSVANQFLMARMTLDHLRFYQRALRSAV